MLRQTVQEEPIVNYVFDCASGESQEYGLQSAPLPSKLPQPRWPTASEDCFLEQVSYFVVYINDSSYKLNDIEYKRGFEI